MEAEGACRLYGRSILKHKFRYIPFVGDGDSKSYSNVCKAQPYGPAVFIPKEDCIGHVTKRMGTALRKLLTTYKGKLPFHIIYMYTIHLSLAFLRWGDRADVGTLLHTVIVHFDVLVFPIGAFFF